DPDHPPDLVIAADTVVFTHAQPLTSEISYSMLPGAAQELLEKPRDKEDNLRMLLDMNGQVCEVVTGLTVAYPVLTAPGYNIKQVRFLPLCRPNANANTRSIDERTLVYFADNPEHIVQAYVDSGEGIDRAGGFAIQGLGGILVRKVEGDYHNVVGFPAASFFKLLDLLVDEDPDFLDI
ncbi:Maf/Ham1, partial [Pluteus cervinus]